MFIDCIHENMTDEREIIINKLKNSGLPIVIYGASNNAGLTAGYLRSHQLSVYAYCVDEKYYRPNTFFNGAAVISFEMLNEKINKYNVVLGFDNPKTIKQVMESGRFNDKGYIFVIPISNIHYTMKYDFIHKNKYLFQQTYDLLSDDLSRTVMTTFVNGKINGAADSLSSLFTENQYFNDLYYLKKIKENNIFVDCGAYDGDTILEYADFISNKCDKYYAFEPDAENCKKIVKNMQQNNIKNVEIVPKGVWNETTRLFFEENGISNSRITSSGTKIIDVTSIDAAVGNDEVTFIKMDIEGSELIALKGACKTISRCMPMLAVCVYHKIDDLITIPQYISQFETATEKYNFYLRHHSNLFLETVLYAIPTDK